MGRCRRADRGARPQLDRDPLVPGGRGARHRRREVHARVRHDGHRLRRLQHAQVHPQRHGALHLAVGLSKGKPCLFRQSYYKLGSLEGAC